RERAPRVVGSGFFFQAEDGIRGFHVTGVQTCALPISKVGGAQVIECHRIERIDFDDLFKLFDCRIDISELLQTERVVAAHNQIKIGRASCRERVERSGGGGTETKKTGEAARTNGETET